LREIEEVKPAARLEDPSNLSQCAHFLIGSVEMVEHETGEDPVERRVGIRQRI